MPKKIKMIISNGNTNLLKFSSLNLKTDLAKNVTRSSNALGSPMISRIHNIKPGCGSCGR